MADEAVKTRRRDATSNTERLITAARSVFARNGQASLEEIAAEAGLGIATLYRHFPNRELLTRAVYRSIFDTELVPLLTESCAQSTPRATFMAIADRLLDLVDRERGLIASSANFAVLTDELLRDFVDPFAILLRRAQHAGEIRADLQPHDIPRIFSMLLVGLSTPRATPAVRRRYLSLAFDALNPPGAEPLPPLDEQDATEGLRTGVATLRIASSLSGPDERP
ncbi:MULTISPECIES: TetR/AcrR family transcriptional regulator [Blastococcus]|jgi:AcrR family transcriptional regulator|uniref:TetR/AcrR family transcriptional regulator n=1 Tax=Blastococcus saxobsidens TaxID=138336 RepID=A0A6L9W2G3_9ACTN|nr:MULTISPECIES: TetR/AcrR family transcriptional regulator [Blastococcus]MCF6735931.1 TetR/AcrR family transcriptional regulator [Blastococcus sp. KM273129]NEK86012.1 TetR/AcrR family transcriptional regulator [Blastococcus saxobsidens]